METTSELLTTRKSGRELQRKRHRFNGAAQRRTYSRAVSCAERESVSLCEVFFPTDRGEHLGLIVNDQQSHLVVIPNGVLRRRLL